jgi:Dyggve-Melchior-Clausen syndrome protein
MIEILHLLYKSTVAEPEYPLFYITNSLLFEITKDEALMQSLQKVAIPKPSWLDDRRVAQVTVCDLFIIIQLRVIQHNFKWSDSHIHLISCGVLLHVCRKMCDIQTITCQRIIR